MKTQYEIEQAVKLLTLALTGQIKLRRPMTKEVAQQTLVATRVLQWILGIPTVLPMEEFLKELEDLTTEHTFNPQDTRSE